MNKSKVPIIYRILARLLLKRTCILSDTLHFVGYDGEKPVYGESKSAAKNADVVILGKEHYKEQNRSFPVQSRRELNKILMLEAANSNQIVLYKIGNYVDGLRHVLYWTVDAKVLGDRGLKPLMVIPESMLLLSRDDNHLYSVTRNNRTFWFVKNQGNFLAAEKRGLLSSAKMFLASAGLSEQTEQSILQENYLSQLLKDLVPTLLGNLPGFNAHLRKMDTKDWLRHGIFSGTAAVGILVVYFGLTSVYLNMRLEQAQQEQEVLSTQVSEVFDIQKELLRVEEKSGQLNSAINLTDVSNVPWRFIVPLLKSGVKIKSLGLSPSGKYSLSCEAKTATEVLEIIKNDEAVIEPTFSGQVNNYRGVEHFTIKFKLKEGV